jgi:hypothetical protein
VQTGLPPDSVKLRVNVFLQKDLALFVGENQISPIFAIPKNIAFSGDLSPILRLFGGWIGSSVG